MKKENNNEILSLHRELVLLHKKADEIAEANINRTEYELSVEKYKIWREKVEKIASDHLDFLKWDAIPFEWDTYYQAECTPQETAIALIQQARAHMQQFLAIEVK